MKKICVFLPMIILCFFILSACTRSIETPMDELTTRNWAVKNPSGIGATLVFDADEATFTIFDSDSSEGAVISGALATDNKKFYITSDEFSTTFEFGYRVFKDRAEVTFDSNTLTFYPMEEMSQSNTETSGKSP